MLEINFFYGVKMISKVKILTQFMFMSIFAVLLTSCGGGGGSGSVVETPPVLQPPPEVVNASFISTHFSGSENCAVCHNGLSDNQGEDVSIESDWSTSMMANATRDPFWQAKVASEISRNPHLKELIDEKCSRCHAPMANVEAKFIGAEVALFDGGFLDSGNSFFSHSRDGVSCTVCHQIEDDGNLGTEQGFSGNFSIVDLGISVERTAFGQYQNPAINPMLMNTGFRPTYAEHISTSVVCATCHNLKTPYVDSSGTIASTTSDSEFPEQMIYSEWENSSFATGATQQSCQDCHMPKTDGVRISNRPFNLAPRNDFSRHTLVGANTTMLDILASNKTQLGVTANGFADAIEKTRRMLESSAQIEVVTQELVGEELTVQLRIINNTGHKLPGGYPSRRVYLHFVVNDENGNVVFESGKTNSDGSIVGADGDMNLTTFEPHYEEITQQDQVQIYGTVMANTDNEVTYTLLRAATYAKDNRLTPTGFDKHVVINDIRVAGAAFTDDNFNLGSDLITYKVNVGAVNSLDYYVELKYQTLAYGFVKDLFLDSSNPVVAKFETMYNSASIRSETIARIESTIP